MAKIHGLNAMNPPLSKRDKGEIEESKKRIFCAERLLELNTNQALTTINTFDVYPYKSIGF